MQSNQQVHQYKYLVLLVMLYLTAVLASVVTGYKMVKIGSFVSNGGLFIYPLTFTVADIVAEIYGYSCARKMIWSSIICDYIFAFSISAIVRLPSPENWHYDRAYHEVLGHTLRFVFAGTLSVLISSFINIYVISKWKVLLKGRYFWLRSLGSTAVGEIALNSIGLLIGFAGIQPVSQIIELGITMYLVMLAYSAVTATPLTFLVYYLKKKEGIDIYDYNLNYNPFKLSS